MKNKLILLTTTALVGFTGVAIAQNSFPASGRAGVGTLTPRSDFEIVNKTNDSSLMVGLGGSNIVHLGYSTSGFGSLQAGWWGLAPKPLVLQGGGGNIGFGKANPDTKVDILGGIHASDSARFGEGHWATEGMNYEALSTFGGSIVRGNSINAGQLTVGGWSQLAPVNGLYVAGDTKLDGDVAIGPRAYDAKFQVAGNMVIAEPLGSSVLDRQAQQRIYGLNGFLDLGLLDSSKAVLQAHQINVGNQPLLLNPNGGPIVVNGYDATPGVSLDVNGPTRFRGPVQFDGPVNLGQATGPFKMGQPVDGWPFGYEAISLNQSPLNMRLYNKSGPIAFHAGGSFGSQMAVHSDHVSIATRLVVDDSVGIGTTTPDANLTINGSAYSGSESSFIGSHFKNNGDGGDTTLWLQNSAKNAYLRLKNNYSPIWLKIDDGTTARMVIDNSGNVGIGKDPQAKLDVAGDIRIGGTTLSYPGVGRIAAGAEVTIQSAENNPLYLNPFHGGDVFVGSFGGDRNLRVTGKVVATTLELTSDRNVKAGLAPVDAREVLAKVAGLPIYDWNYTNAPAVPHKGPMAQGFKAAFGLGEDDKHISVVDGIGVALAAIQGLHEMEQEKDAEIAELKRQLSEVKQELAGVKDSVTERLAALETTIAKTVQQASYARPHPGPLPQERENESAVQQASFRPEATR